MYKHDHWGLIYDMTGHEKVGQCYWCGAEAKKTKSYYTRYCSKQHRYLYLVHFRWEYAVENVFTRIRTIDGYICEMCNNKFDSFNIEVHHIIPLNGENRFMSQKNRPENLLGLCLPCHKETHRYSTKVKQTAKHNGIYQQMLDIQPELF